MFVVFRAALALCILGMLSVVPGHAATPPQGTIVLVTSSTPTLTSRGQSALWRVTPTGNATRLLVRAGASGLSAPVLSPDGTHVTYVVDGRALWQMESNGSHARQLYATGSGLIMGPRYSRDASTIAFTAGCCGNLGIFGIDSNGAHVHTLLPGGGLRVFQDWSPDRKHMLYTIGGALWEADSRGRQAHPLGGDVPSAGSFRDAHYSPDGTHIVATLHPAQGSEAATAAIVLLHTDGQYLTFLTKDLSFDVGSPSWSPDGKRIAFLASSGAFGALGRQHDLWIMRYDGTQKRNMTHGKLGDVTEAGWAR
jgi:Tol biopolymer transport system component